LLIAVKRGIVVFALLSNAPVDGDGSLFGDRRSTYRAQALHLDDGLRRDLPDVRPFADVVALVAFGPAKMAIGLSDIDEHAAQLRAGIAIMNAAIGARLS
jgi:hypothetical protein